MSDTVGVLGSRPVAGIFSLATRGRLRILAYHGIPDSRAFARQLDWVLARGYTTVTGSTVADAVAAGRKLPERPIWITFDDGAPEVVQVGLPLLVERGITATAFVCAGLIDTRTPHWWEVVDDAVSLGVVNKSDVGTTEGPAVRARLKEMEDERRRAIVDEFASRLAQQRRDSEHSQLTSDEVRTWVRAGQEVGNHTWDHPCLDQCAPREQERQVRVAHEALSDMLEAPPDVFAWPNGNPAPAALAEARRLGYRLVLTFDHRLCKRSPDPWAMSRLRMDSDEGLTRLRSIVSGAHPAAFRLAQRLRKP